MKVTREHLESLIANKQFFMPVGTTATICFITTSHGFSVVGFSACLDPAEYDKELGQNIAYDDALNKLSELEGYRRKCSSESD